MKRFILLIPALGVAALFSGCYTQFVMVDRAPPPPKEQVSYEVDTTTGDTVKVIKQIDTVETRDRQTCIWQRDLMGYPRLYCYDSNYPSNWLYYNYSPWWYDEYPYYSGGNYYGGRRHYTHSYYEQDNSRSGSSSANEPAGASGSAYRARVRGVPGPDAEPISGRGSSSVGTSGEKSASVQTNEPSRGQIIIPSSGESAPRIARERSSGVSATGSAVPNQAPPAPSTTASTPPPAPPPPQVQSGGSSSTSPPASPPPNNNGGSGNHRRNPRSW